MARINLGKIKVWIERALWYQGKIFQTITALGVLRLLGVAWYVLVIIIAVMIPIVIFIVYLDMRYVYPQEASYQWEKNPKFHELMKQKNDKT